jgi:hypothetical protein
VAPWAKTSLIRSRHFDRQGLVYEQNIGLEECCYGEPQTHPHPTGKELRLTVDGLAELGEFNDPVESCGDLPTRQSKE